MLPFICSAVWMWILVKGPQPRTTPWLQLLGHPSMFSRSLERSACPWADRKNDTSGLSVKIKQSIKQTFCVMAHCI